MPYLKTKQNKTPWINAKPLNLNPNPGWSEDGNFYQTKLWRSTRNMFIELHPLCKYCQEHHGRIKAAKVVDHIVPRRVSRMDPNHPISPYDNDNLQGLCNECHQYKTAYEVHEQVDPITKELHGIQYFGDYPHKIKQRMKSKL